MQKMRENSSKVWLVENLADAGKIKVPHVVHQVESALLFPYLRGRDVKKWHGKESCLYLLPYEPGNRNCLSEKSMRVEFPRSYEYFSKFKALLRARKTAPLREQMAEGPFYPVLGVGPHTVAKWKVVFKDLTELFQCCVLGPKDSSIPGKPVLADYTLRLIPVNNESEAHYVAALLNSAPCVAALYYSSAGVQTQRYHAGDAEKVAIERFTGSDVQLELANLSKECHQAVRRENWDDAARFEKSIDVRAAEYWGIKKKDLVAIQQALDVVRRGSPNNDGTDSDSDDDEQT
jgi:hypothetical protein